MSKLIGSKIRHLKELVRGSDGLGLVEVLVALAVVGTAMVIITQISLKTIKQARKNELQDVANQVAVEALDFMKQPGNITVETIGGSSPNLNGGLYRLDVANGKIEYSSSQQAELSTSNCTPGSHYLDASLYSSGYHVCQQIKLTKVSEYRFNIKVIVVWQTVGGEYDIRELAGYRIGEIIT
ncbi:hypothetical protein JW766_02825 [Candidatus Dojkabacteria bacterium]|nr:hypothetical protein [Candidatus Dojkabacteria bacterium]